MGWYDAMYGRGGHGPDPNAPEKRGFARFGEIVARDIGPLLGCNAVCCLLALLPALGISLGTTLLSFWYTILFGALSGLFIGPLMRLLSACILRSLQNMPGPWLSKAFAAAKSDYRREAPLGIACGVLGALLMLLWQFIFTVAAENGYYPGLGILAFILFDFYAFTVVFSMAFALLPLSSEKPLSLLRHGLKLAVQNPARCLGGALLLLCYGAAVVAMFPISLFWMILFGFWLPGLMFGLLLFPVLRREFSLADYRTAPPPEDAAPAKPLTPQQAKRRQTAEWWSRHYGIVLVALIAVLGSVYVGYSLFTLEDPDYSVAVVTSEALPDVALTRLETSLEAIADDANGDGDVLVAVNNYTWSGSAAPTDQAAQMAGATRLNTDLANGESAIWLIEDPAALEADYGALSEHYGADWQSAVHTFADTPRLAAFTLGTYPVDTAGGTAEVAPLYHNLTVALFGEENTLWDALQQ